MKWITRKNAHVDRIACPWLIQKFVDRDPEFIYVPTEQVLEVAEREGGIPYLSLIHISEPTRPY